MCCGKASQDKLCRSHLPSGCPLNSPYRKAGMTAYRLLTQGLRQKSQVSFRMKQDCRP